MNRKLIAIIAIFLFQSIALPHRVSAENSSLNPPTRVNFNAPDPSFTGTYSIVHQAVYLYKLDAIEQNHRNEIIAAYNACTSSGSAAIFNVYNMTKDGWARYYPITISEQTLTVRVFLSAKRASQPELPVLYEATLNSPEITIQVHPGINELLADHKITSNRINIHAHKMVETSP